MKNKINRRTFIKKNTAAGIILSLSPSILHGKDDRKVRLGFIGVGGRGTGLLRNCLTIPEVDIIAICDITNNNLKRAQKLVEESGRTYPEGYGEALSGGEREYNFDRILQRINEDGLDPNEYSTYLEIAKNELLIPSAGAGLGIERLIRYITGVKDIGNIQLFRRVPGEKIIT